MAWAYDILPDRQLLISRLSGRVTLDDFLDMRRAAGADARFDATHDQLIDLRGSQLVISTNDIMTLASSSIANAEVRRALVGTEGLVYGLARMYGAYREISTEKDTTRVFRTLRDACEWLGVPESEIEGTSA